MAIRTDLASEAAELAKQSVGELKGVVAATRDQNGVTITDVRVLDDDGAKAVGKPIGRYITLEVGEARGERFEAAASALAESLILLIPQGGPLLIAGLGNREITPDAVGPLAVEEVLVTRHLVRQLPEYFIGWRVVSAMAPGVMGVTGLEALEVLAGAVERVKPAAVVVIDALASRSVERLCTTVQISDSGIVPGSGVGNRREALSRDTLGVPVIAMGVPTVVDAPTLAADLLGCEPDAARYSDLFVTPRDIDRRVADMAKLCGVAVSMAAHGMDSDAVSRFMNA